MRIVIEGMEEYTLGLIHGLVDIVAESYVDSYHHQVPAYIPKAAD